MIFAMVDLPSLTSRPLSQLKAPDHEWIEIINKLKVRLRRDGSEFYGSGWEGT